jgi:hypothetical protein
MTRGTLAALALLWCAAGGCAHAPAGSISATSGAPEADSTTVALWRMDEASGTRMGDSGPFRMTGATGRVVQRPFGRFGNALGLEPSIDSFAFVPYNPELDLAGAMTVEAWIFPTAYGNSEDTPIAARWSDEANQQSWILSLAGRRLGAGVTGQGPGRHAMLFPDVLARRLQFAYQPAAASPPRVYTSTRVVELGRWTHVAVTYDGGVVRIFLNGELDAQFASPGEIRSTQAPLLIGNSFDPRALTGFEGDLHPELGDPTPFYAFQGRIDELRLSRAARTDFPTRAPK